MVTMSYDKYEQIEANINNMVFRPGMNFDPWYPTEKELSENIRTYNEADVRFLMWLLSKEGRLSEEERSIQKFIKKLLYNPKHLVLTD